MASRSIRRVAIVGCCCWLVVVCTLVNASQLPRSHTHEVSKIQSGNVIVFPYHDYKPNCTCTLPPFSGQEEEEKNKRRMRVRVDRTPENKVRLTILLNNNHHTRNHTRYLKLQIASYVEEQQGAFGCALPTCHPWCSTTHPCQTTRLQATPRPRLQSKSSEIVHSRTSSSGSSGKSSYEVNSTKERKAGSSSSRSSSSAGGSHLSNRGSSHKSSSSSSSSSSRRTSSAGGSHLSNKGSSHKSSSIASSSRSSKSHPFRPHTPHTSHTLSRTSSHISSSGSSSSEVKGYEERCPPCEPCHCACEDMANLVEIIEVLLLDGPERAKECRRLKQLLCIQAHALKQNTVLLNPPMLQEIIMLILQPTLTACVPRLSNLYSNGICF